MLCQNCGNAPATTHYHTVINGVVNDKYLCSDCLKKAKQSHLDDDGIFKMLTSFLNDGVLPNAEHSSCEVCGMSFAEIRRTGRVGCGSCYKTFYNQLGPTIKRLQGSTQHIGKRPETVDAEQKVELSVESNESFDVLKLLKEELKKAIEAENYEKAAELRDLIRTKEG